MPKIPQYTARPSQLGPQATPDVYGTGRGLADLGRAVGNAGELAGELFEQEMASRVSGSLGRADQALNTLRLEVEAETDHHKRNQMYSSGAQKIANKFREGLRYPKFQGLFDERMAGSLERGRMEVAHGVRRSQLDASRGNRMLRIEQLHDDFDNTADAKRRDALKQEIYDEIKEGVAGGLWNAEQAAAIKIRVDNRIESETLLAESQAAADEIMASTDDQEQRLIAAGNLPSRIRDDVRRRINSRYIEETRLQAEAEDARLAQLLLDPPSREEFIEIATRENLPASMVLTMLNVITAREDAVLAGIKAEEAPDPYWEQEVLYDFYSDMAKDPLLRNTFLEMKLYTELGGRMEPGMITKLQTEKDSGAFKFSPGTQVEEKIQGALGMLSLPPKASSYSTSAWDDKKEKHREAELFRARARDELMKAQSKAGRPLSSSEAQDVINLLRDEIILDVDVFYDDTILGYKLTKETEFGDDVPDKWAKDIRADLTAEGLPANASAVRSRYRVIMRERVGVSNQVIDPVNNWSGYFPTRHPYVGSSNVILASHSFPDRTGRMLTYAIPTMVDGKKLSGNAPVELALSHGLENYPAFNSVPDAERWIEVHHGHIDEMGRFRAL